MAAFHKKKDTMIFFRTIFKSWICQTRDWLVRNNTSVFKSFIPFHLVLSSFSHGLSNHYHSFHVSMPFSLIYCWQDLWITPKGLKRYIKVIGKVQLLHQTVQVFPISGSVIHSSKRSTHGSPTRSVGLTKPIRARFRRFMVIPAHRHQLLRFSLQHIWNTDTSSRVKNLPKHTRFGESWEFWTIKGEVKGFHFAISVRGWWEKLLCHREAQPATVLPVSGITPPPQLTLILAASHQKGLCSFEVQELAPWRFFWSTGSCFIRLYWKEISILVGSSVPTSPCRNSPTRGVSTKDFLAPQSPPASG